MSSNLDVLAEFANLLATAPSSTVVNDLLVQSSVALIGASAGAVLIRVDAAGMPSIVAQRAFDIEIALSPDDFGTDLATRLLEASKHRFSSAAALPLVAAGGLYGILVLLFPGDTRLSDEQLKAVGALADMGAATLLRAQEVDELKQAVDSLALSRSALVQAEKLRALGGMAAGLSHDLRNVFAPLLMVLELLKRGDHDAATLRKRIEAMRRPLENGLKIVDRLRLFSRRPGIDPMEIGSVNAIVADAVDLCRPRLLHGAKTVAIELVATDAPLVRVEIAEAVAAVTNLVVNALDAVSAEGGTVVIRSGARDEGAIIEVSDSGPGVPAEARDRIFEQFFTTKGKTGTGLGLPLVRDFVQNHGGKVQFESPASGGARFTIWLPAAREPH